MRIPPAKIYFSKNDRQGILEKIDEALESGQLTMGKNGQCFENDFSRYIGTRYAIGVNSGTSAIEIPLRIFGVQGKEVLVPTNTFFATILAILHAGGRVRFLDSDQTNFSISVESLKENLTEHTVAVVVVHIGGFVSPQMPEIQRICSENNILLFEDAAHAHGSLLNGHKAGTFGHAASFSFYPTKVMTSAEGGMIVTDDEKLKNEAMLLRDQGKISFLQNLHDKLGYNWRMSEPHAIIGAAHLARLETFIEERRSIAKIYDSALSAISGVFPMLEPEGCRSNYYKYMALLAPSIDRAKLKKRLREDFGVGLSGEVYETPCHLQPIWDGQYSQGLFPIAEDICRRHICLPIFPGMKEDEAQYVVESLDAAIKLK